MSESKSSTKFKGEIALNQAKSNPSVIAFVFSVSSDDLMCQVACTLGNECGR